VQDITHRKRAEEERRGLEVRIQRAQKFESLAVMASGVAHDFNNLLVMVLGNASLARAGADRSSQLHAQLCTIETAAERARELVQQLQTYAGATEMARGIVMLSSLVRETAALVAGSVSRRVAIECDCSTNLPAIEADATQLRQVVLNLLLNAAEAMRERSGCIQVRVRPVLAGRALLSQSFVDDELPEGLYASIEVRDSGSGIEPGVLPRIFDPFFSTKSTGRGLGLAAVLGIVRAHGGAIRVESRQGQGTAFHILLPATQAADSPGSGTRAAPTSRPPST
jgi:two-component system, cell cycle sensor histidine kinase and response regulator CckA